MFFIWTHLFRREETNSQMSNVSINGYGLSLSINHGGVPFSVRRLFLVSTTNTYYLFFLSIKKFQGQSR